MGTTKQGRKPSEQIVQFLLAQTMKRRKPSEQIVQFLLAQSMTKKDIVVKFNGLGKVMLHHLKLVVGGHFNTPMLFESVIPNS